MSSFMIGQHWRKNWERARTIFACFLAKLADFTEKIIFTKTNFTVSSTFLEIRPFENSGEKIIPKYPDLLSLSLSKCVLRPVLFYTKWNICSSSTLLERKNERLWRKEFKFFYTLCVESVHRQNWHTFLIGHVVATIQVAIWRPLNPAETAKEAKPKKALRLFRKKWNHNLLVRWFYHMDSIQRIIKLGNKNVDD